MEPDQALTELRHRVDGIESSMGSRIAVLERQVIDLRAARQAAGVPNTPPLDETSIAQLPPPPERATATSTASTSALPPPPQGPPTSASPPNLPPPPTAASRVRPPARSFELGVEVILRWAGVSLVVLAAVFLVRTAIIRGWLSPELQLLGAALIGFAMIGAAFRLVDLRRVYALALANGGAVVLVVCAGAAHIWLDLYDALTGLIMVAIAAAIVVASATKLRMESVAVTATAAMLIVPTWARIIADAPVMATGIWLGSFAAFATFVGLNRRWVLYRVVSTWASALWVLGLAAVLFDRDDTTHAAAGIALVAVVGLILWLNPALAARQRSSDDGLTVETAESVEASAVTSFRSMLTGFEHRTAMLVPIWSWSAVLLFGGWSAEETIGPLGLLLAVGFATVAVVAGPLQRWISDATFGSHLLGVGLLTTVATVAWLGGPILMVAIAVQAVATLLLAYVFPDSWLKFNAYALAAVALLLLLAGLGETVELERTITGDNIAHGVVVAALAVIAWLTLRREQRVFGEAAIGVVWLTAIAYIGTVLLPFVDDRGWLVVGVVLSIASLAAKRLGPFVLWIGLALAGITLAAGAVSIIDAAANGADLFGHLANLLVVTALVAATALLWLARVELDFARALFIASWVAALAWLASVLLALPQGQVAVSITWAIAACAAIVAGIRSDEAVVRFVGLGTLAVVLTKLLTVDLAEVDTLWRVGLFMLIGLGLLRLGYLLPTLAERFGQQTESEPAPQPGTPTR